MLTIQVLLLLLLLLQVSITPRTQAPMGSSQYIPSDQKLLSREQLFHRMCLALGGRAAEALVFNKVSTGARDDLSEVSAIARKKVQQYGMNERVGLVYLPSAGEEGGRRGKRWVRNRNQLSTNAVLSGLLIVLHYAHNL